MASPANEGGVGGKLRKRPFRRIPATPYDRPLTAVRGVRGGGLVGDGSGWISKLVDPASRLIASGASKLFSSVFRRRLTAPPAASEGDHHSREEVYQMACDNISPAVENGEVDGINNTNNSDNGGIAEIEQLLVKQKINRDQYVRLSQLLLSRTVEPSKLETEIDSGKGEKAQFSAQGNGIAISKIPKDEAASPAELAKAYMVSRALKISDPDRSPADQVFKEDVGTGDLPSALKPLELSVAPRSVIRFSGIPDPPELGHQSSRRLGRSAIYRMSRSPYFKVNPMAKVQVGEFSIDGHAYPSSSQWTPRSSMQSRSAIHSGGKQVLKRGSSVLDDDFGSYGPIRRIRQKSNLLSPSKDKYSLLSGNQSSKMLTPPLKDAIKDSTSLQKSLKLAGPNHDSIGSQATENGHSLFPQSSERAQKLFQQLDKLFPSPNEKLSEPKSIFRDESPSKLTLDMLRGSALRSTEDIDSSKIVSMQESGNLEFANSSQQTNHGDSHSRKQVSVKENGPSKPSVVGVKLAAVANSMSNAHGPPKVTKLTPVSKRPSFQISAPEDSIDLDDDEDNHTDISIPSTGCKDGSELKMLEHKNSISDISVSVKPTISSSQCMPFSDSASLKKNDKKAPVQPVIAENGSSFAFPVATDSCLQFQPPTPTMPTPLLERLDKQKEQMSPLFGFASNGASLSTVTSTSVGVNDIVGLKTGEESEAEPKLSKSSATTTSAETSIADKSNKEEKPRDQSKPFQYTVSSETTKSSGHSLFSFSSTTATNLSNGSPRSFLTTFSVPNPSAVSLSTVPTSSVLPNGTGTPFSSSSFLVSSASSVISSVPPFQFGQAQPNNSNSSISQAEPVKATPFSIPSFPAQDTSAASTTSFANFNSGSSFSALPASAVASSSGSSSALAPSSLSSASPSSGFGFSSLVQSSSSSASFSNDLFKNSSATTLGASNGSPSSSSLFSNNSSQTKSAFSSDPPAFGIGNSSASPFGSVSGDVKPFTSGPAFSFSAGAASSTAPTATTSPFSFSSTAGNSSAPNSSSSSPFAPAATTGLFGLGSQASASSLFASNSTSNTSPSTGFAFGLGSSPFTFGSSSSSGSMFSFNASSMISSSSRAPAFGFGSTPSTNDQMSVEDTMADDTNQAAPAAAPFANPGSLPCFAFGSSVQPSGGVFQFGGQPNPSVPQGLTPFQPAGSVDFNNPGGSFSLGSGGGDKSARKFVKVKRGARKK